MNFSPRNRFYENLSTYEYTIPYSTKWIVSLYASAAGNDFNFLENIGALTQIDYPGFQLDKQSRFQLFSRQVVDPQSVGLYFAQRVSIPGENMSYITENAPPDAGGFMGGIIGSSRNNEKTFTIDFLETNLDFVEGIIRPWIITASYRGLIETSDRPIKATVVVTQYDANDVPRKVFTFYKCVPFSCEQSNLSYDVETVNVKTVGFLFNNYEYKLMQA